MALWKEYQLYHLFVSLNLSISDGGIKAVQGNKDDPIKAYAKKFKEVLQALVRAVQEQIGTYKHLQGVRLARSEFYTLLQVEEEGN